MQEDELSFGGGEARFYLGDGGGGFGLGARGDVDFGVVLVEDLRELLAYAGGGAGDDEDLDVVSIPRFAWANGWGLLCPLGLVGSFLSAAAREAITG